MTQLSPVVMVFARSPVPGTVKRRLAATIGEEAALRAHCELVENVLTRLESLSSASCVREIWVTGGLQMPTVREWSRIFQARPREQVGVDIGASMRHALNSHLRMGRSAVLMGSDVPPLDVRIVEEALNQLQSHDVVIAPCEDGGYGLIGASRPVNELFVDIDWGTDRVFAQTMERAREAEHTVAVLETVWDVDDFSDWERFRNWRDGNPGS